MIWFAIAAVLIVSGAMMLWLSRTKPPPPSPPQKKPENLSRHTHPTINIPNEGAGLAPPV